MGRVEIPRKLHVVEMAKIIFIGLLGFEDLALLHIAQGWTNRISVLQLLAGFPMFTVHLVMLLPTSVALAEHAITPHVKVLA